MEEIEEEFDGFALRVGWRRLAVCVGFLLVLLGGVEIFLSVRRLEMQQEEALCSYELRTEGSARVHLLPNPLYEEEWMESGQICAGSLTDYVELTFTAALSAEGEQEAAVSGSGQATAVLSGYQMSGDSKKEIYAQKTELKTQTSQAVEETSKEQRIEMTLRVRPSEYLSRAEEADQILGGTVSKTLSVLFEGSYQVAVGEKTQDEPFSCQMEIPLVKEGGFFEITPLEPNTKSGEITQTDTKTLPIRVSGIVAGGAGIVAGSGLIFFILWMTREPKEEELWERKMRGLLRKFGSRLLCVEKFPKAGKCEVIRLREMDGLIQAAEELHSPVLYVEDTEGLPEEGRFLVKGEGICYEVQFPQPPSTLVEEGSAEGGK